MKPCVRRQSNQPTFHRPPGPSLWSGLGNLRAFQQNPLDFLARLEKEYGGVACFSTGLLPVYLVTEPQGVRQVLQNNYRNYSKDTYAYAMVRSLSGQNLLTTEGATWLRRSAGYGEDAGAWTVKNWP